MGLDTNSISQTFNDVLAKYHSLDSDPRLAKLNINNTVKPSNIALALTAILALVVVIISPLGVPVIVLNFVLPARVTLQAFREPQNHQWILVFWLVNALLEIATPLVELLIPGFVWTIVRLGVSYYLVVMKGGEKLYRKIMRRQECKQPIVKSE